MTSVSISQLKTNPSEIIKKAYDYPVAVEKRNEIQAYLIGKDLFDRIVSYIEDFLDKKEVKKTDYAKGKDFEQVAAELGI